MTALSPESNYSTYSISAKNKAYSLNHDIYFYLQDDVAQLLDFRQGQFYGLDPMGTLMVSSVLEQGEEKTVKDIAQAFGVTEEQVSSDLTQLLQNLEQKKLIISKKPVNNFLIQKLGNQTSNLINFVYTVLLWCLKRVSLIFNPLFNKEKVFTRRTVELLLTLSWISFRSLGWSRTISLWQNWHQQPEENKNLDSEKIIKQVDQAVREAAAWQLFLPMVCKERALVGYHILRTFYGLPANLVVGVDHYPFQIHAWVECNDEIVTDDPEHCETFISVVSYP